MKSTNRTKKIFLSIIFPVLLIAIWHFAVVLEGVPNTHSTTPLAVIKKIIELFADKTEHLFIQIGYSLMRLISGVLIGCLLGIIVAFTNTIFRKADNVISPTLNFLAPIPIVIWIPFFIMIFGIGAETYKIGLIAVSTFFLIYINLYTSYKSINKNYLDIGAIYEKKIFERFKLIYFPYGLESLFTALRLSIAIGWIVIYVVEYGNAIGKTSGLGYFIAHNKAMGNVEKQFAGVIILAVLSFIIDFIIQKMQKRFLKWQNKEETV